MGEVFLNASKDAVQFAKDASKADPPTDISPYAKRLRDFQIEDAAVDARPVLSAIILSELSKAAAKGLHPAGAVTAISRAVVSIGLELFGFAMGLDECEVQDFRRDSFANNRDWLRDWKGAKEAAKDATPAAV